MALKGTASIAEAEGGYRRGVVMGLTMAEIMLLFVFCLLLVAAGMVSDRDSRIEQARAEIAVISAEKAVLETARPAATSTTELHRQNEALLQENMRFRETLLSGTPTAAVAPLSEDSWRELVLVREIVTTAAQRGVTLREVLDEVAAIESSPALQDASSERDPGHQWPPIITLGSDRFRFKTNSAELTPQFRDYLVASTAPQVQELLESFQVDVIEVVGHTDESPIAATRPSTMDTLAIRAMRGEAAVGDLVPADNAGLGLARAIAVVNALRATSLGQKGIKMIPLSAAQVVMPGDVVSDGASPEASSARRRIEIRVRRSMPSESNL